MKKLIIFLLMMCGCCGVKAAELDGKYLSQSGEPLWCHLAALCGKAV